MTTSQDADYPRICSQVGLACDSCTAATARQLAAICKGLRGRMIGQLFVQIHPHPACAKMHRHFTAAYHAASSSASSEETAALAAVA